MKKEKLLSLALFTLLGLIALQIPFTRLLGSNVKFTLFDFLAPTLGAFLGTLPGILSVLTMQVVNLILHGGKFDAGGIIRVFPTLFAVAYFAKNGARPLVERTSRTVPLKRNWYWERTVISIIVPILCILAFNLNPIGRSAWQYSLFWLIPIAAHFFRKNLFVKSLGATFTAHAVGGALWVWTFGLSKQIWLSLIPQVILERTVMAVGIAISYVVINNLLPYVLKMKIVRSLGLLN